MSPKFQILAQTLYHLMHLLDEIFSKTDRHMWCRKSGLTPVAKPMSSSWGGGRVWKMYLANVWNSCLTGAGCVFVDFAAP